jgi:hypothetical protein
MLIVDHPQEGASILRIGLEAKQSHGYFHRAWFILPLLARPNFRPQSNPKAHNQQGEAVMLIPTTGHSCRSRRGNNSELIGPQGAQSRFNSEVAYSQRVKLSDLFGRAVDSINNVSVYLWAAATLLIE